VPMIIEDLANHIRLANPFDQNRVTQADSLTCNVAGIHEQEFADLKERAQIVARGTGLHGQGVVLSGEPGIGKSHLLARFGDWAREERFPFVYLLNLQAGPEDILRTVLRTSISILTREFRAAPWDTRLYRMIATAIKKASQQIDGLPTPEQARVCFENMLEELGCTGTIAEILWVYFEDVYRQRDGQPSSGRAVLARRWLMGEFLDREDGQTLGIHLHGTTEDGSTLTEEGMKEVIRVLCRFSGFRERAFILCFDQVDTLNEEQVRSWASVVHAMLDTIPHLLVVTSGVHETFLNWPRNNWVHAASWEPRIRQFSISLTGVTYGPCLEMVQQRLADSLTSFRDVPRIAEKRDSDSLFPIGNAWKLANLHDDNSEEKSDLKPRQVLSGAARAWAAEARKLREAGVENWLRGWPNATEVPDVELSSETLIDQKIAAKLAEHINVRKLRPEELPVDDGNLLGLIRTMLVACLKSVPPYRNQQYKRLADFEVCPRGTTPPAFQLIIRHFKVPTQQSKESIGLKIAHAFSGNAATHMLRRIVEQMQGPKAPERAILVVDARETLQLGAVGRQHLETLKKMGPRFFLQILDFEQYASLDALEVVVGLAKARDLEVTLSDGTIHQPSEAEVYESHHRNERYISSKVICDLVGNCKESAGDTGLPELDINALTTAACTQLALKTGLTTLELADWWVNKTRADGASHCPRRVHDMFKSIVLKMHDDGRVKATAVNDYFMVLPTRLLGS